MADSRYEPWAMKRISPKEAKALMDAGWTYLDVRSEGEFQAGHPEGAFNVPLLNVGPGGMAPNPDFLAVVQAHFPKDQKLVVGCQAGGRSLKAATLLEAQGYTQVVDQRCGFGGSTEPGWAAEKLPVATGAPSGRAYPDLAKKR
jgi:rhodanese-related sulfurtransferase